MTLVQLRHLLALVDCGSFSQAAQRLFITQPALSRSIRALESELGVALIDRVGRLNDLTPIGRELVARAHQLVSDAKDIVDHSRMMAKGHAGLLRIGMGAGPGAILVTPLLTHIAANYPRLRVDVVRGRTQSLVPALRERTLDVIVVDLYPLPPDADLRIDTVKEVRGTFMCRRGHPLTRKRGRLAFADLRRYPIAGPPLSDVVTRTLVDRYGVDAHPARCLTIQCEELDCLVELAERTDTVLLSIRASGLSLVELPVVPPLASNARFGLVTLAGRTEAPGLAIIRQLMQTLMHD